MIKTIIIRAFKSPFFMLIYAGSAVFCQLLFLYGSGAFSSEVPFAGFGQFFSLMQYVCIFLIPFTTVYFDDKNANSIQNMMPFSDVKKALLQRSAALVLFSLFLFITVPMPASVSFYRSIDTLSVLFSYFIMLLYAASIISVVCFLNACFQNKAVVFFISAAVLSISSAADIFVRQTVLPQSASSLISYFSLQHHAYSSSLGIIDSRDVLFYAAVFFIFLVFETAVIYRRKKGFCSAQQKSFIVLTAVFAILFCTAAQIINVQADISPEKIFSVSKYSKELFESLSDTVRITYYRSPRIKNLYPQSRGIEDYLLQYAAAGKDRSAVEFINPDKDEAVKKQIEEAGITGRQFELLKGSSTELITVYSGIIIEYLDQSHVIPLIFSPAGLEYDLSRALSSFIGSFDERVIIIAGNSQQPEKDFPYLVPWLERAGFKPALYSGTSFADLPVLPSGVPLIIAGSSNISILDAERIERHIHDGGPVFFAVSPVLVEKDTSWAAQVKNDHIIKMLNAFGLSLQNGLVMDEQCWKIAMTDTENAEKRRFIDYYLWPSAVYQDAFSNIQFFWPSFFNIYQPVNGVIKSLLVSSERAFTQTAGAGEKYFITDPFMQTDILTALKKTSKPQQFIYAASFEGKAPGYFLPGEAKKTVRLTAAADQYFLSKMISYTGSAAALDFTVNSLLWLTGRDALLDIRIRSLQYSGKSSFIHPSAMKKEEN